MRLGKPIIVKNKYENDLYEVLLNIMTSYLLKFKQYFNSSSNSLITSILEGKIQYTNSAFYGRFNAKISRDLYGMGAKYNKVKKGFEIDLAMLTPEIQKAIAVSQSLFILMHKEIIKELADTTLKIQGLAIPFDKTLEDLDEQTIKTFKDEIKIIPKFDKYRKTLKSEYVDDIEKSIRTFSVEQVQNLREQVIDNFENYGFNKTRLEKIIEKTYNVTANKARFLAKQETSLLVSKYREARYRQAGIKKWKWSNSNDSRVRDWHKTPAQSGMKDSLGGKIFSFDEEPPIINLKTGKRGYPGEDFGCRCVMIPVFD